MRIVGRVWWIVVALVAVFGVGSSRAQASPLSELAASLEPGDWGELATEQIDVVLAAGGASGIQIPYSEDIVWDPQTQRLFFVGGDHDDIAEHIVYSESTNTWQLLTRPAWIPGSTMHGYDHSAIDPSRRFLYHRPFANNSVHRYDIDADAWSDLPPPPDNGTSCCDALEFFPDMDGLLWTHHSYGEVWLFGEDTQEWTMLDTLPAGSTWQVAEYNPVHQLVLFAYAEAMYQLTSDGTITPMGQLGAPIYDGSGYNGVLTVDPVSGDFLVSTPAGYGNRTFHVFDAIESQWAELPTQPVIDLASTAMVATPIADYGVTLFVYCYGGTPCGVLAYKHAPFRIPPDPDTSTGGEDSDGDGTQGGGTDTSGDADESAGDDDTAATEDGATAPEPTGVDDSGSGEDPAADDDGDGCACRANPATTWRGALLPWLVLVVAGRLRRRRIGRIASAGPWSTSGCARSASASARPSCSRASTRSSKTAPSSCSSARAGAASPRSCA
jgi:hypothetical protein